MKRTRKMKLVDTNFVSDLQNIKKYHSILDKGISDVLNREV